MELELLSSKETVEKAIKDYKPYAICLALSGGVFPTRAGMDRYVSPGRLAQSKYSPRARGWTAFVGINKLTQKEKELAGLGH